MDRGDKATGLRRRVPRARVRGFTFVAMLVAVAIISIGLAAAGPLWSQRVRRDHERELLRIGTLYSQALAEYRDHSPGSKKRYPMSLDELTQDGRSFRVRRYMRRLYPDPITPTHPWGLIRNADGEIIGVFSQSEEAPISQSVQSIGALVLPPAASYSQWRFIAPTATSPSASPSTTSSR